MGDGAAAMNDPILFSSLSEIVAGQFDKPPSNEPIRHVSFDTRKGTPGDGALFFCLKGPNHDGHRFIEEGYQKGWRWFVVERIPGQLHLQDAVFFVTKSPLTALHELVAAHRHRYAFPVIGITGSNGKTIVKEWLYLLLAEKFAVVKSPKSYNSQVGVPLSVWNMAPWHDLAIFEAGISQPGEMEKLEAIIQPTVGIITNIGSAHDAFFASTEAKLAEKMKLFARCQKLIYCTDHPLIDKYLSEDDLPGNVLPGNGLPGVERIGWGTTSNAKYQVTQSGPVLKIVSGNTSLEFALPFTDEKSIENLSHCLVAALEFGVDPEKLKSQLRTFTGLPMRLALKDGQWGSIIVDDSYNNDLQGLEAALDFIGSHSHAKPVVAILSDILQTGSDPEVMYKDVGRMLVSKGVKSVVAIGPQISRFKDALFVPAVSYPSTEVFLKEADWKQLAQKAVLVKGARSFGFEKIVKNLQAKVHRTVLEINLEAMQNNFHFYKALLAPEVKTMVMLKAFAYGSGSGEIGRTLQYLKASYIAVAYPDEGITLRGQGIHIPIMVMNPPEESFDKLMEHQLEPEIYGFNQLATYLEWAADKEDVPGIHLKLDTGMHRLGFSLSEMEEVGKLLAKQKPVRVISAFTHLAASEDPSLDYFTNQQVSEFLQGHQTLTKRLHYSPLRHVVNTSGISRFPQYHFDMVRIGIGLHGVASNSREENQLQAVATLKTVVSQVRTLEPGQTVGYGRAGRIEGTTEVATIAVGYADGYRREFGMGKGRVLINGQLVPTIGSICMDMCMVDVTGMKVKEGDEVVVFGTHPTVTDLAAWASTIPYEILTSISDRVKREYLSQ